MKESPVIVRKAARFDVAIRGQVSIAPVHGAAVRLSPQANAKDGWVEMDAVDFSNGGIGMVTGTFLPRGTSVRIRLFGPHEDSGQILECGAIVRRVVMTDRRPAYQVGTSFQTLNEDESRQVLALIKLLESGSPADSRGS